MSSLIFDNEKILAGACGSYTRKAGSNGLDHFDHSKETSELRNGYDAYHDVVDKPPQ